jgi:hypothetical protein
VKRVIDHPLNLEGFIAAVLDHQLCQCGCGGKPTANSKYAIRDRCRQQAYHNRVEAVARDQGVESRPNLTQLTAGTGARSADVPVVARKPRKRNPDLRLSYRKVVDALVPVVTELLAQAEAPISGTHPGSEQAQLLIQGQLRRLLSKQQLAALEQSNQRGAAVNG